MDLLHRRGLGIRDDSRWAACEHSDVVWKVVKPKRTCLTRSSLVRPTAPRCMMMVPCRKTMIFISGG